jgi:hypothetical protein
MHGAGNKQSSVYCLIRAGLDNDDRGDIFLRNVSLLSQDYTAMYPRR